MSKITIHNLVTPKEDNSVLNNYLTIGSIVGLKDLDALQKNFLTLVVQDIITGAKIEISPESVVQLTKDKSENLKITSGDIVAHKTDTNRWTIGRVIRTSRHELSIGPLLEIQDINTNQIIELFPMHVIKLIRVA